MKRIPQSKVARWPQSIKKMALVYACCLVLVAALSFGITYAYFSAKVEATGTITVGRLEIQYLDASDTTSSTLSTLITRESAGSEYTFDPVEDDDNTIVPGDIITITGSVENTGSVDGYVILQAELILMNENNTAEEKVQDVKFYNLDGAEITYDETNRYYNTAATALVVDGVKELSATTATTINFVVDTGITSELSGRTFVLKLTIHAIQSKNLEEDDTYSGVEIQATNMMLSNIEKPVTVMRIYGNSVQDTTPTPSTPVEIQSVGEQTKNLLSIKQRTLGTLTSGGDKANVRTDFEFDKYYAGLTMNNYYYPNSLNSYSVDQDVVTVNPIHGGYGIGFPIKVKPNTKYTISMGEGGEIGFGFYTAGGEYISHIQQATVTTPANCEIMTVMLRPTVNVSTTYKNVQLEEGSIATEYEPYGYKVPVTTKSKNLFKVGTISDYYNSTSSFSIEGDTVIGLNRSSFSGYMTNKEFFEYKTGESYTFSFDATAGTRIFVALYDENKNNITSTINYTGLIYNQYYGSGALFKIGKLLTFTSTNTSVKYLRFGFATYDETLELDTTYITLSNIQLEKGSEKTNYEPFIEGSTYHIYIDEPLRKVGDYADYIEIKDGVATVVRNVRSLNLNISDMNNSETYPGWKNLSQILEDYPSQNQMLSSITSVMSNITNINNSIGINTGSAGIIWLEESKFGLTQTEWKTNYPNMVVNICYGLQTSEAETIELPEIFTLAGNTIYDFGTTIQPSDYYFG